MNEVPLKPKYVAGIDIPPPGDDSLVFGVVVTLPLQADTRKACGSCRN